LTDRPDTVFPLKELTAEEGIPARHMRTQMASYGDSRMAVQKLDRRRLPQSIAGHLQTGKSVLFKSGGRKPDRRSPPAGKGHPVLFLDIRNPAHEPVARKLQHAGWDGAMLCLPQRLKAILEDLSLRDGGIQKRDLGKVSARFLLLLRALNDPVPLISSEAGRQNALFEKIGRAFGQMTGLPAVLTLRPPQAPGRASCPVEPPESTGDVVVEENRLLLRETENPRLGDLPSGQSVFELAVEHGRSINMNVLKSRASPSRRTWIVLFHGFCSSNKHIQIERIARAGNRRGFHFLIPQFCNDFSDSGGIYATSVSNKIEDAAAVLRYVLADPDVGDIFVGGHSTGGLVSLFTLEDLGAAGRFRGFINLAGVTDPGKVFGPTNYPQVVRNGFRIVQRTPRCLMAGRTPEELDRTLSFVMEPFFSDLRNYTREAVAGVFRGISARMPCLFVIGEDDLRIEPRDFLELAAKGPRGKVTRALLPGEEHFFRNRPDKAIRVIMDWLCRMC
jgi:pimeloyl-ACP methyl ester carboxylesterase